MTRSRSSHCLYSLGTSYLSQYIDYTGSGLGAAGAWGILRERVPRLGGACGAYNPSQEAAEEPSTIEEAKAKAKEEAITSAKRLLAKAQAMRFTTQEVE